MAIVMYIAVPSYIGTVPVRMAVYFKNSSEIKRFHRSFAISS